MGVESLYTFREQRTHTFHHRIKIFIFGEEVSPWIQGGVTVTYGNRESYNTASFNLSNPYKIWQITKANLKGVWRSSSSGMYSEEAKRNIFQKKNKDTLNQDINLTVRQTKFGTKDTFQNNTYINEVGKVTYTPPMEDGEKRFRMSLNDCIFNKHDPIRIFVHNPLSINDEWMEIFCGFIQDHPVSTNFQNGESTVRIGAYCIRNLMTKMRVRLNAFQHTHDPQPILDSGFYADFARESNQRTHAFSGSSLENTVRELITGTSIGGADVKTTYSHMGFKNFGVGKFKMGNVICYDPKDPGNILERWHLMTMFGVNKVPFPPQESPEKADLWLTTKEVYELGESTLWSPDLKDSTIGPEARYLHLLLPKEGTGAANLVNFSIDKAPKAAEWIDRWSLIRDLAAKLDFQVLVSPSGDILVEFPFYGFTPQAFSRSGEAGGVFKLDSKYQEYEGLHHVMTYNIHQKEETLNDEAEDFPTILEVAGGMAQENLTIDGGHDVRQIRSYVFSPVLVSRYGVISETYEVPYAGQNTNELNLAQGATNASDTVLNRKLSKLGLIEFTKRMAEAATWEGSLVYRPFLFPNRPVFLKNTGRIGTLTSVTHQWNIGVDATTNISMNMLMSERYNPDKDESSFHLITGAANTPISYRSIWSPEDYGDPSSGVPTSESTNIRAESNKIDAQRPVASTIAPNTTANYVTIASLDYVWPYFRTFINNMMAEAAKEGITVAIISSYRTPQRQIEAQAMRNSRGVSSAEPFGSFHQYGLAIDVAVSDKSKALSQPAMLASLDRIATKLSTSKIKVLSGKTYNDPNHFHVSIGSYNRADMALLNKWRNEYNEDNPHIDPMMDTTYLDYVWKKLNSYLSLPSEAQYIVPPVPEEARTIRSVGGGVAAGSEEIFPSIAPECVPETLRTSGFDKLKELKGNS